MKIINGIPVFGNPLQNAVDQMVTVMETAHRGALMADHHLGYSQPIGGVVAYKNHISPSGVGYDIACGNKAVRLDMMGCQLRANIDLTMDRVWRSIEFGIGRAPNASTMTRHGVSRSSLSCATWRRGSSGRLVVWMARRRFRYSTGVAALSATYSVTGEAASETSGSIRTTSP